jgi:hypothetical protein
MVVKLTRQIPEWRNIILYIGVAHSLLTMIASAIAIRSALYKNCKKTLFPRK